MVRITFLHPDLGLGGAERLVIDAAVALKNKGHKVHIVTSHHDPDHCFTETKNETIPITVFGDWLPRHIFGKFYALCAYIRMIYAAICIIFSKQVPEIVFCDIVSACIPILKLRVPLVIFYCHFPDQLLSTQGNFLKQIYRKFLNYIEEITTGKADKILVNSHFTQEIFQKTFKKLDVTTEVLYPSVNTDSFDKAQILPLEQILKIKLPKKRYILLSINRYERKKNLCLCIKTIYTLKSILLEEEYELIYMIIAGGYDKRVVENVEYYLELMDLAEKLNVKERIIFLRSPTDLEKISILSNCNIVLYTPSNEHFGIVPLEAMYVGKPVVALNSGGPRESIQNNITGFLTGAHVDEFAEKIAILLKNETMRVEFGEAGRKRFMNIFSFQAFSNQLNNVIENFSENRKRR